MNEPADTLVCPHCGAANRPAAGRALTAARCGRCGEALSPGRPVDISGARLSALRARDTLPFIVDIWAPWCGPCRMMAPALDETAKDFAGRLRVFKLNSDEEPQAAASLGVRGLPTLLLFRGASLADTLSGLQTASALKSWLARHVGAPQPVS